MKYFACSDIHSHYSEWMDALHEKGFDLKNSDHKVIVCGDLFDRGNESVKCYEFAKSLADQDRLIYVRGNHEDLMFHAVTEIDKGLHIGQHHISNGTIKTLSHFLDVTEYDVLDRTFEWKKWDKLINETLVEFIINNTVDYFELGDTIFVHGWVPTCGDKDNVLCVSDKWREGDWTEARWENGMELFHFGITIPDKTIVCGHWHASYGHCAIAHSCAEWGPNACFQTFSWYDPDLNSTIHALDACTVYTRTVNCMVFDWKGKRVND